MALNLQAKKQIVDEVANVASTAISVVAADYRGLSVGQMTELRKKARESGVYLRIVRNTLARLAVDGTSFSCIQAELKGPLILAFSKEEPGSAARLLRDFAKENEQLTVKLVSIDGELLGAGGLDAVASLPTRQEALAKLVTVMQAPIVKFVRTLAEPKAKFVRTLAAVRDKKAE